MSVGIIITGSEDSSALATTQRSLEEIRRSHPQLKIVTYPSKAESVAFGQVSNTLGQHIFDVVDELDDADYLVCVPAGAQYSHDSFDRMARHQKASISEPLYVHELLEQANRFNTSLKGNQRVAVTDSLRIWNGVTPPVVRVDIIRRLREGIYADPSLYFAQLFEQAGAFTVLTGGVHLPGDLCSSRRAEIFTKEWYFEFLKDWDRFFGEIMLHQPKIPAYYQKLFTLSLQERFYHNRNTQNKQVLQGVETHEFLNAARAVLQHVSDDIVLEKVPRLNRVNRSTRLFMSRIKNGDDASARDSIYGGEVVTSLAGIDVAVLSKTPVVIDSMDYYEGNLEIAGYFPSLASEENYELEIAVGKTVVALKDDGRYADYNLFGERIHRHRTFLAKIPFSIVSKASAIVFQVRLDPKSKPIPLHISFRKSMAKLSNERRSYWRVNGVIMKSAYKKITLSLSTPLALVRAEVAALLSIVKSKTPEKRRIVSTRLAYWITKPLLAKRPIWIFYDKLYKAGDNGEYAYLAARKYNDGIRKYYVQRSGTPDARRFKKHGIPFLKFGTLWHRLLFLNANIVFATHTPQCNMNGFKGIEQHFRGLFGFRTVFIQHGLTVQRIPWYQQKYIDNTRKYFVASPLEKANLLNREYGYSEEDIVEVGLARYDGLIDESRDTILIAPSWRNYLAPPATLGFARGKDDQFMRSSYFSVLSSLIHNAEFRTLAERNGLRVKLLLHPVTSAYAEDFEKLTDFVEVYAAADDVSYEAMLREASLLITDYSGVQFDFAYMDKPVLYYHHPDVPPSYTEGAYNYARDGLGKIVRSESEVLAAIEASHSRNWKNEAEYSERIDRFFCYRDQDNGARIYRAALEYHTEQFQG